MHTNDTYWIKKSWLLCQQILLFLFAVVVFWCLLFRRRAMQIFDSPQMTGIDPLATRLLERTLTLITNQVVVSIQNFRCAIWKQMSLIHWMLQSDRGLFTFTINLRIIWNESDTFDGHLGSDVSSRIHIGYLHQNWSKCTNSYNFCGPNRPNPSILPIADSNIDECSRYVWFGWASLKDVVWIHLKNLEYDSILMAP